MLVRVKTMSLLLMFEKLSTKSAPLGTEPRVLVEKLKKPIMSAPPVVTTLYETKFPLTRGRDWSPAVLSTTMVG